MKILIATLLLGALGAGSFQFAKAPATEPAAACPQSSAATVRCTGEDTCEVTCTKLDGTTCTVEIACDGEDCRVVGCPDCPGGPDCPPQCAGAGR